MGLCYSHEAVSDSFKTNTITTNEPKSNRNDPKLKQPGKETSKLEPFYNYQLYNGWQQAGCSSNIHETLRTKPVVEKIVTIPKDKDFPMDINCFDVAAVRYSTMELLQIGIERTADFVTCRRFLAYAINRPATILSQLVIIIESLKDMELCTCALRILHKIIVFAGYQKKIPVDDIFHNFNNASMLIEALVQFHDKYGDFKRLKDLRVEWDVKVLHIVEILSGGKQWRNKLKHIKKNSVEFLGRLLANKITNVELVNHLLALIKLICADKNNCQLLSNQGFYLGLCDAFNVTRKINMITDILQCFVKIRTINKYLQQKEEILILCIDMIAFNSGKNLTTKRKIMDMLYKLATNNNLILKILRMDEYFFKLLFYFMRKGKMCEYNSQIKAFSLLNRSLKHIRLNDEALDLGFALPPRFFSNVTESKSSDEDDSEDEEFAAEHSETSEKVEVNPQSSEEPLTNVSPYFIELLECRCTYDETSYPQGCCEKYCVTKLKRAESNLFEPTVYRLKKINHHAYPDAAMLNSVSYNELVVCPKCDSATHLLCEKLRCHRAGVRSRFPTMVVFDLDLLHKRNAPFQITHPKPFVPGKPSSSDPNCRLTFESRFECGNLRKAIQVEQFEYELFLTPDTYTNKGFQWFYFEVANMLAENEYTFNINNFCQSKMLYMEGMHPLMFSVIDHQMTGAGWKRTTGSVAYFSNNYTNKTDDIEYKTLSFSLTFPHSYDFVYFAYHYPYTYSRLIHLLEPLPQLTSSKIYLKIDRLCKTINNFNGVPLLTITARSLSDGGFEIPYKKRPIVFITGRVHPGESNASWIIEGIIKFLLNENDINAIIARQHYIFKIVPMLNPEGVIYGNTRRGLTGIDLNRCWNRPSKCICPEIYHTKRLVAFAKHEIKHPVAAFIDIHGHSKKKFFFLYGCNPKLSWDKMDKKKGDSSDLLSMIPNTIHNINPNMQLSSCQNRIRKHKESTARVVFWREFDIKHSYTLECTYSEVANKLAVNTKVLTEIGSTLVTSLGSIARQAFRARRSIPSLMLQYGEWVTRDDVQNEHTFLREDLKLKSNRANAKKESCKVSTTPISVKLRNATTTTLTVTAPSNLGKIEKQYLCRKV
ncbi:hypothetical protein RN001_015967 [Aquatica leii]|uniref:Peptidase M14 domain-containing protein n=1 Tax=Aquatica leii TaxID=1421715 RepID=A0AAN7SK67_9COLE|nr:hypothetical protein RN001_015967 [Aquatica leii]